MTWTQGRRLSSITKGSQTYSYEYDMSGVRSVKIANGERHEYVTQNGSVVRDYVTNANTGAFVRCLDFFYDQSGRPLAMRKYYNSTLSGYDTFHYVLNAQGDVVQINYQGKQNKVYARYTYDAYGNVLTKSGSLADVNPLRYRGYYCDTETGFYYLQSRYYDPTLGRFINADSYASTGQGFLGFNMFAYCNNNPANGDDPTGHSMDWTREAYSFGTSGAGESCAGGGSGGIGDIIWAIIQILKELTSSQAPACIDALPYTIPSVETKSIPNAEKKDEEKKRNTRTYSVYFLEDENNVIQYVGRVTDDGFTARMWYHKKTKGLELAVKKSGLSYEVARGMEEIGMLACHTLIPGSKGINNRIHGISFKNKEYNSYLDAANEYLKNKAEEDFLNFITFQ